MSAVSAVIDSSAAAGIGAHPILVTEPVPGAKEGVLAGRKVEQASAEQASKCAHWSAWLSWGTAAAVGSGAVIGALGWAGVIDVTITDGIFKAIVVAGCAGTIVHTIAGCCIKRLTPEHSLDENVRKAGEVVNDVGTQAIGLSDLRVQLDQSAVTIQKITAERGALELDFQQRVKELQQKLDGFSSENEALKGQIISFQGQIQAFETKEGEFKVSLGVYSDKNAQLQRILDSSREAFDRASSQMKEFDQKLSLLQGPAVEVKESFIALKQNFTEIQKQSDEQRRIVSTVEGSLAESNEVFKKMVEEVTSLKLEKEELTKRMSALQESIVVLQHEGASLKETVQQFSAAAKQVELGSGAFRQSGADFKIAAQAIDADEEQMQKLVTIQRQLIQDREDQKSKIREEISIDIERLQKEKAAVLDECDRTQTVLIQLDAREESINGTILALKDQIKVLEDRKDQVQKQVEAFEGQLVVLEKRNEEQRVLNDQLEKVAVELAKAIAQINIKLDALESKSA